MEGVGEVDPAARGKVHSLRADLSFDRGERAPAAAAAGGALLVVGLLVSMLPSGVDDDMLVVRAVKGRKERRVCREMRRRDERKGARTVLDE